MKLPILHPGPDRPVYLQMFSYSSFRRSCWLWRSAAGGPVGRTMVEPVWQGAFTPWHQTQQRAHPGHSATPPHSLPRLLCLPAFSSDMFLSFCSPVCLFLSVFSPQRRPFSAGTGGRVGKCHGCTDPLQLGPRRCLWLTEGSLFSTAPVGDGGAAEAGQG